MTLTILYNYGGPKDTQVHHVAAVQDNGTTYLIIHNDPNFPFREITKHEVVSLNLR